MKRKVALITSLCAIACGAVGFTNTASFALERAAGLDYYPLSFTKEVAFSELEDFAVSGDKYAFLQSNVIYEYSGDELKSYSDGEKTATSVYYTAEGALCYGNSKGIFIYDSNEKVEIENKASFDIGSFHYYTNSATGVVSVLDTSATDANPVTSLEGFSNLKESGGKAYAVFENALYEIKGATPEKLTLEYLDYSDTQRILKGDVDTVLKNFALDTPRFVTLTDGAFLTEVNIDETQGESGEYFSTGKTVKVGGEVSALSALLLARTGADDGISVIMICDESESGKGSCYLMNSKDVKVITREAISAMPAGTTATVTVAKGYMYTAPYVCESTHVSDGDTQIEIESGLKLEVLGEVSKATNPELVRSFYKIRFTEDGKERVGYVPTGYVSHFTFVENDPIVTPDPDYSEENLVRVVVLVLLVVALVLGAGGYMIYSATSGKRKKNKKVKKSKNDD